MSVAVTDEDGADERRGEDDTKDSVMHSEISAW